MAHYFTDNRNLKEDRKEHSFRFSGRLYTFTTDHGVFSMQGVDYGTRVLLEALAEEQVTDSLLDLGCGYGVIGIICKNLFPDCDVTMVDVNPRAVELAQLNSQANSADCHVFVSDGFSNVSNTYQWIVTNPPIRAGKKVIYAMFDDAYTHLHETGVFLAVIRKQQGAESALKKLKEVFGNCEVIAKDKGYWILKSYKLTAHDADGIIVNCIKVK